MAARVDAVERIPELLTFSAHNLAKYDFDNVTQHAAGQQLGLPQRTFERILVSAAADTFPRALSGQLTPHGIIVIPVRNSIVRGVKSPSGTMTFAEYPGFSFVPLIDMKHR